MRKVIFLDIDDVLKGCGCDAEYMKAVGYNPKAISPLAVRRLITICRNTGADIVFDSKIASAKAHGGWGCSPDDDDLYKLPDGISIIKYLDSESIRIDGCFNEYRDKTKDMAIQNYLDEHHDICNWIVIDVCNDKPASDPDWIRYMDITDPFNNDLGLYYGLHNDVVKRAVTFLNDKRNYIRDPIGDQKKKEEEKKEEDPKKGYIEVPLPDFCSKCQFFEEKSNVYYLDEFDNAHPVADEYYCVYPNNRVILLHRAEINEFRSHDCPIKTKEDIIVEGIAGMRYDGIRGTVPTPPKSEERTSIAELISNPPRKDGC